MRERDGLCYLHGAYEGPGQMKYTVLLEEIGREDRARVGGKAFCCAELRRAGVPVPDGLVVLAEGMDTPRALEEVRERMVRWPEKAQFAVRSSAADEDGVEHSFAGIHETRLNAAHGEVSEAIHECWESVRSPRALAYRRAQGLETADVRTAVLVQVMVQTEVSGVAFTRNPVSGADEVVIDACRGLGEAVVSGQVEPDQWRLRKDPLEVTLSHAAGSARSEAAQPCLSEAQVRELAKLLLYIEKHYGAAQDVEWCWEKGQFWIVQSRPVTGAAGNKTEIEWTRANVREVLPDLPCPQVVHEVKRIIDQAQREHFGKLWAPEEELGPIIKEFCGRLYFNLSQLLQVSAIFGAPPARLMRAFGGPKLRPEDERVPPLRAGRVLRALPSLLRVLSYQFHLGGAVRWSVGACDAEVQRLEGEKPEAKSDEEIWKTLRRPDSEVTRRMKVIFTLAGLTLYEDLLQTLLGRAGLSADDLIQPFLAAGGKSVSAQQAFDLLRLAKVARDEERAREYFRTHEEYGNYREALAGSEFLRRWEEFLKLYGHRGLYESDWSLPRYAEDPSPLLAALRAHVLAPSGPAPEDILSQQEQRAGEAWARFENQLNAIQRVMLRPAVRWLLRRLKQMFIWREQVRSEMVRVMSAQRPWHLALAARFAERGWIEKPADYFLMTFEEIAAGLHADGERAEWKRLVAERTTELEVWSEIEMPLLLRESDLANLRRRRNAAPIAEGRRLQGLCVSRGCAEGEVVVLRTPHDFARMKRGAIIVAPATDPSWTPLFTLAAGVIVEIGGMLSHASTVAREYGLPALANVTGATRFFKDGDRVRLDATQGIVELVAQEHAEV